MATTELGRAPVRRGRVAGYALACVAAVVVAGVAMVYFNRPPQMGPDEDVFHTVDALYTAVRAKDAPRLAQCEERLHGYRDAGKLPKQPAAFLDGVIAAARGGKWEAATERLYEFMLAQRREGRRTEHPEKPRPAKAVASRPQTAVVR